MKLLPAILILAAFSAHADETRATLTACPNGQGLAVVAEDGSGQEAWAGCWGADAPERRERHREQTRKRTGDQQ
jgi:hypothetical protein